MNGRILVIGLAALAAGCGSQGAVAVGPPTTGGATHAQSTSAPTSATTNPTTEHGTTVQVWFVRNGMLWPVARPAADPRQVGRIAVRGLLGGPTPSERAAGVSSFAPGGVQLLGLSISRGVATVDLTSRFAEVGPDMTQDQAWSSERTRLAQLVYTLTQFPTVRGVHLQMDGTPVSVFGSDGVVLPDPITRARDRHLVPPIVVTSPGIGGDLTPTTEVRGLADVFEANVRWWILDATGHMLASGFTTATCGTGCLGSFRFTPGPFHGSGAGTLVLADSDASGIPAQTIEVRVPVRLAS